ncbi:unnamed protein product, partial [Prorocentrum cordatum]
DNGAEPWDLHVKNGGGLFGASSINVASWFGWFGTSRATSASSYTSRTRSASYVHWFLIWVLVQICCFLACLVEEGVLAPLSARCRSRGVPCPLCEPGGCP